MASRLDLHDELCKILGSTNVYYNPPESVKMKYPAIVYSLNEYGNKSANSGVYLQWPGYNLTLIDKDPDSPIAQKLSVLRGCQLSRPPYPADGLYHFPFTLKTTNSKASAVFDEYYDKGYKKGLEDGNYWGGFEDGKKVSYNEGYSNGVTDGKQAEQDTFWDNYQNYGNRRNYINAFSSTCWNDNNFNPKYPIVIDSDDKGYDAFQNAQITDTKVVIDYSAGTNLRLLFSYCGLLKTIRKIIVSKNCIFDRTFNRCTALENITFEGEIGHNIVFANSTKLSEASVQNIINCLADFTGQTTRTIDFPSTVVETLTDEQLLQIDNKNWEVT